VEFKKHLSLFRTTFPLILPDPSVVDHALDLADGFTLSHWDSMLLGACRAASVTTLFTEDMGAPRTIDSIQLVNPLI
jgi:predicted nucleic acid-binding protein